MNDTQTFRFTCPNCGEKFAQAEEPDEEIHAGETYHCSECGGRVVFKAAAFEEYALGREPPG